MKTDAKGLPWVGFGARAVGCFPLYPPVELLHSLRLVPVVLWGLRPFVRRLGEADRHLQDYCCSVTRCLAELVLSGGHGLSGFLSYNACDTLRNLPEILAEGLRGRGGSLPVSSFHLPASLEAGGPGRKFLRDEIERLIRQLESTYATSFSPAAFEQSVAQYRVARGLLAKTEAAVAEGRMTFAEHARLAVAAHHRPVQDQIRESQAALDRAANLCPAEPGARVILSGILPPPPEVCRILETAGLRVVGNDIAALRRSYDCAPAQTDSPLDYYEELYTRHFPCTTLLHTAENRVARIEALVEEQETAGLIFLGEKFCEYELFEYPYLAKRLRDRGVQTLPLEFAAGDEANVASVRTRIEAFAEMLAE